MDLKKILQYKRNGDMDEDLIELFADGLDWSEIAQAFEEEHPSVLTESIDIATELQNYLEKHPGVVAKANEARRDVARKLRADARKKRDNSWAGESMRGEDLTTAYSHKGYEDAQRRLMDPFCRRDKNKRVRKGGALNAVVQMTEIEVVEDDIED